MTYFVHSPALDFIPLANTLFCNVRSAIAFRRKWDVVDFVNANDINCHIPISCMGE